jgi:hypothetical protein
MRMLDKGTAQIDWSVTGQVAVFPVTLAARTVLEMNLLTGRVTSLKWVAAAPGERRRLAGPAALGAGGSQGRASFLAAAGAGHPS